MEDASPVGADAYQTAPAIAYHHLKQRATAPDLTRAELRGLLAESLALQEALLHEQQQLPVAHSERGTRDVLLAAAESVASTAFQRKSAGEDIIRQQQEVQALHTAQERLQATLDSTLYVVQAFEAVRNAMGCIVDFTWVFANKAWRAQYGEPVGKRLLTKNPGVVETGLFDIFVQVTETGIPVDHEQYYNHEQFNAWFHQTLVKMNDGFVMHTQDITARKQQEQQILRLKEELAQRAEDKYRTLFNAMDEGFCLVEVLFEADGYPVDYRFLEVNPAFERLTGLPQAAGRTMRELAPTHEQHWFDHYAQVARTGEPLQFEQHAAALHRWYHVNAFRLGPPEAHQVAIFFLDINALKRRETQQALLAAVTHKLADAQCLEETMQQLGETVGRHFGVQHCLFAELNTNAELASCTSWNAQDAPTITGTYRFDFFSDAQLATPQRGGLFLVENTQTDDRVSAERYGALDIHAFISVPHMHDGQRRFVLALLNNQPRSWHPDEVELLRELTARIGTRLERARTEEALARSEDKYRRLFTAMDEGYCIIQLLFDEAEQPCDWRFEEVNPAFEQHNGLVQATGKRILELTPDIEPKWFAIYGRVAATGEPLRFEENSPALGRWFTLYAFRVGAPAEHRVAVLFRDVSARRQAEEALRQSEEQFRLFLTTTSHVVYKVDADWQRLLILEGNRLLNNTREPSDTWLTHYIPVAEQPAVRAAIQAAIATKSFFELEHRVFQADGTVGWAFSRAVPMFDDQGVLVAWFGTASDITARKQAQQVLRQSKARRLEQAQLQQRLLQQHALFEAVQEAQEAERRRIAEGLHNGVGQTLYATKLRLDMLHTPVLTADPKLAAARRDVDRLLADAIRQTRAISHELVPTALAEFGLKNALQNVCRQLSTPSLMLRCVVTFDERVPPLSKLLQLALYRMAQELGLNIVRHARGATEASLELETMPGFVLLRAEDNGIGFTADADPGLGLRTIRDRVALLNGTLELSRPAAYGTFVRLRIPLPASPADSPFASG